nr:glycosyltransferase family 2 protein [Planctomycetota bacterium]
NTIDERFEILLVDDRSPDGVWNDIVTLSQRDGRIRGIRLSRTLFQHQAITAGLDASRGRWVVVMDCDLQDIPEEIPRLYAHAAEGFDIVLARRCDRTDSFIKRNTSRLFYRLLSLATGTSQDCRTSNFGIYRRRVIDSVLRMREAIRFFPTMVSWVGFESCAIDVEHGHDVAGSSGYTLHRSFQLALNVLLAFSDRPLKLIVATGGLLCFLAGGVGCWSLAIAIGQHVSVPGWASLMVMLSFSVGFMTLTMGFIGLYVGRVFDEVKSRPLYLVDTLCGIQAEAASRESSATGSSHSPPADELRHCQSDISTSVTTDREDSAVRSTLHDANTPTQHSEAP